MRRWWMGAVALWLAGAACTPAPPPATPTPTVDVEATVQALVQSGIETTLTALPTPTDVPTATPLPTATPVPTPTSTPSPTPATLVRYESSYHFDYPVGWRITASPSTASSSTPPLDQLDLRSPEGVLLRVSVHRIDPNPSNNAPAEFRAAVGRSLEQIAASANGTVTESGTPRLIQGRGWLQYRMEYVSAGTLFQTRWLITYQREREYALRLEANAAGQERYGGVLEQMASSLDTVPASPWPRFDTTPSV